MKFSARTVTLLWDVHTWVGVIAGLVLAAMFFAGSISLFHHEIEAWQDPPIARGDVASLDTALATLDPATLAGKPVYAVPPSDHAVRAGLFLGERELIIEPGSGAIHGVRSRVGQLFFHLHFMWHEAFPTGMVIAGVFGVLLLLAIVTGVVMHLKDLRRQAFRFRPWLRPRYIWSDLHKVLGVWGLPFQIMIAFTGAVICLGLLVVGPIAASAYGGDRARGNQELYGGPPEAKVENPDAPATMLSFAELTRRAAADQPGFEPTYVAIDRWGRVGARATVYGDLHDGGFHPSALLTLDATDGSVLWRSTASRTPSMETMSVVYGIHFATYGGLGLRLVYFLLGLAGWLTILSGNWIWIERRAAKRPTLGTTILGRLTLGLGGGIVVAAAAVLWLNRLTPPTSARPAIEVWGFFAVWAAAGAIALAVPLYRRSWAVLLAIGGAGFLAVPLLSAWTSPAHLGNGGGVLGWRVLGIDVGIAVLGALLLICARVAWRRGAAIAATAPAAPEDES
jgi:uncharacterized iron-regulated membrane protein